MSEPFRVNILTIFPEMFESFFSSSILGRAREQGLIDIRATDIRPYSKSKHHNTDDYPVGGGFDGDAKGEATVTANVAAEINLRNATIDHQQQ